MQVRSRRQSPNQPARDNQESPRDRAADNCGLMVHFRFQKMQVLADDKFPVPELDRMQEGVCSAKREGGSFLRGFCLDMRQVRPPS